MMKEEKISTDEIKMKLVEKYNLYFALWKDFNLLVAILATVGLLLGMHDWAQSFEIRGEDGKKVRNTTNITMWYIFLTTILALIANFIVFALKFVWKQYRQPMAFFKELTLQQDRDYEEKTGQQSKLVITENYSTGFKIKDIVQDP